MNAKPSASEDVGVIVGRFQVHELHPGQVQLIEEVLSRHDKTIVFIGLSPLRNTTANPLDFSARKKMFQEQFPQIDVYYIDDNRDDTVWSNNLDREIIKLIKPRQTVRLYGSRGSFISSYFGKFPTEELESTILISGTEVRRKISNNFPHSKEFRAGMISASFSRYPICYTTVDVAILDYTAAKVLLAKKETETELRFVGGFSDPTSPSFEHDAKRETREEADIEIDELTYLGSTIIDDWRYKSENDKIKTVFYAAKYIYGSTIKAKDDIAELHWVDIESLLNGKIAIVSEHKVLVDMLRKYVKDYSKNSNVIPNPTVS